MLVLLHFTARILCCTMACHTNSSSLLVFGYARDIENRYLSIYSRRMPIDIVNLIYLFFPKQYKLYGVGSNLFGEFALDECKKLLEFHELSQYSNICDDDGDIYYGSYRYLIKTISNEIYSAGWNLNGALGVHSESRKVLHLTKIKHVDSLHIDHISSGLFAMHTFIWHFDRNTHKNTIYAFGNNKFSQFGDQTRSGHRYSSPYILHNLNDFFNKNNVQITNIQCGAWHSLFLSKGGSVYSCGKNKFGQCGMTKEYDYQLSPSKIPFLYHIRSIRCGEHHSMCLDQDGDVYVFGNNVHGQLAMHDKDIVDVATLNPYFRYTKIVQIECGSSHSVCVNKEGDLWSFGRNQFGQLGTGSVTEWDEGVTQPHLFQSLKGFENVMIASASCGLNHTAVLTKSNDIYCFGENYYSQCSTKLKNPKIKHPNLITKTEIGVDESCFVKRVIAGYETTIVVFEH
eukprot:46598_1